MKESHLQNSISSDPKGWLKNYTTEYVQGESGTYIIGITNNEYKTMNYTMEVRLENKSLPLPANLQNIRLAHNTTLEEPLVDYTFY